MKETETLLPAEIVSKARMSGREYGWRRQDIVDAISAAPSAGLAVIGGQVQFVLPGGTCEMYWMAYDPSDQEADEPWDSYAIRSAKESLEKLREVMSKDLVQEGVSNFDFLKNAQSEGVPLEDYLLFIAYFQTQEEAARNTKDSD